MRWREKAGLSGDVLVREAGRESQKEREGEKFEEGMLLALKLEGGTQRQDMQAGSRSWKRQSTRFSPRAYGRNAALPTELGDLKFVSVEARVL